MDFGTILSVATPIITSMFGGGGGEKKNNSVVNSGGGESSFLGKYGPYISAGLTALNTAFSEGLMEPEEYASSKEYLEGAVDRAIAIDNAKTENDIRLAEMNNASAAERAAIAAEAQKASAAINAEAKKFGDTLNYINQLQDKVFQGRQLQTAYGERSITGDQETKQKAVSQLMQALQARGQAGEQGFLHGASLLRDYIMK